MEIIAMPQLSLDFTLEVTERHYEFGCIDNINSHLPMLYETQREDVLKAEIALSLRKAYMFTNATGTGKTFLSLGIIARFQLSGKRIALIVVPTDKKCIDWIKDGEYVGVSIRKLEGIHDANGDVMVTTYANYYQNEELYKRSIDLIVYDESHYLIQNASGTQTSYFEKHQHIACLPNQAKEKAKDSLWPRPLYNYNRRDEPGYSSNHHLMIKRWDDDYEEMTKIIYEKTKVVFLSATPFAYHKTIKYADGTLWFISQQLGPDPETSGAYNEATGFNKFLCDNFGYRMRTGKCTIPETGVNISLLEQNFFEKSVEEGLMSTRQLNLDFDYSRHFVKIDSELGSEIDRGMGIINSHEFSKEFKILAQFSDKHFNYLFVNQMLEVIKAKVVLPRIQEHLDLNRKIVIFHSYNNSSISHPFRFNAKDLVNADTEWQQSMLEKDIEAFNYKYQDLYNLNLSDLKNTRDTICDAYPKTVQFNGTVNKKKRSANVQSFNTDYSETDIILVQTRAGREGISLHDLTGEQPRVLITLGLPIAPTEAIQAEGRIYREGLLSNAVYEYITLQTAFESYAFSHKIASRSRTAENLAMGLLARDLESAFKDGYSDYTYDPPNLHQGIGGVETDRDTKEMSAFEKSCTYYYARQAKTSRNKSSEGIDYFATPEPLGFKFLEWLDLEANDDFLEPSAGHGAIGRWASEFTVNHFVEASYKLASELALNVSGKVHQQRFEDYHIGNKFKGIAMNPPFGKQSATAVIHVVKALRHLREWGCLYAIIPGGNSFRKKYEQEKEVNIYMKGTHITGVIKLPSCLFKRAGTNIMCKVLRIQRFPTGSYVPRYIIPEIEVYDFTECINNDMFFGMIEHLEFGKIKPEVENEY